MENVVEEQGLALPQHFPHKSSKFSDISNWHINLLFNASGLKLGNFDIFYTLFPLLAFFKV